jgi:redox-sensitive bicupin YhaK (pirin superfamily)
MSLDVAPAPDPIATVLEPRERVLPARAQRAVGPFIFFDHFGPTTMPPGHGLDVRPHPHVNLATVTYLFDGEIDHRDSLGSFQTIRPGEINWMTAGRGIVHSERTPPAARVHGATLHGLQLWVGLPREHEEAAPAFHNYAAAALPVVREPGVTVRVLAGEAFGARSPVHTLSRVVYLDVTLDSGATVTLGAALGDRGVYVISGDVSCAGRVFAPGRMLVLTPGVDVRLGAERGARFVVVGGDAFPEPRHLWWNFASSQETRIEAAKRDWIERRGDPKGPFPLVPGDEADFIPIAE